jgi:hypothetical protein
LIGLLGALWTFINLKLSKWRMRHATSFWARLGIVVALTLVYTLLTFGLSVGTGCRAANEHMMDGIEERTDTCGPGEFNPVATLLLSATRGALKDLMAPEVHCTATVTPL